MRKFLSNFLTILFLVAWGLCLPAYGLVMLITVASGGDGTRWIVLNRSDWLCSEQRRIERTVESGGVSTTTRWSVCHSYTEKVQ